MRRLQDLLGYAVFRAVDGLIGILPVGIVFRLGAALGAAACVVLPSYRRLAEKNLRIAFGDEWEDAEIKRTARRHFRLLGGNLLCGMKMARMSDAAIEMRLEGDGLEKLAPYRERGAGILLALCHMGCWEALGRDPRLAPDVRRRGALYQPLSNPLIDRRVRELRTRMKLEMFDRARGMLAPSQLLANGGTLGALVDQHAGDKGLWVPFFGRLASTSTLAAVLAKRSHAIIVPVAMRTTGPARWSYQIGDPIEASDRSAEELTAQLARQIEDVIRISPADWFWVHQRWKTPQPNFVLDRYKRGVHLQPDMQDLAPFRIVVRSPNWLGDACMAAPAIKAIARGRPDGSVTVLAPEKLAAFWRRVPEIDDVLAIPSGASVFATAKIIRAAGPFDAAVLLPNSTRSALEARLAGVPEIVGYRGSFRKTLLTAELHEKRFAKPGPPQHHAMRYLELARQLGAAIDEDAVLRAEVDSAGARSAFAADSDGEPLRIGLCPGAEYGPAKRWPPEKFAAVAREIAARRPDARWILFGTAADADIGAAIAAELPEHACENLIGQTSLDELIDELARCALVLTNDTGTMHLAAFLGIPTVAVFGSTEPNWTGPLGARHRVIRQHVECSPCFLRHCPLDFRCMREIHESDVAAAVRHKLESASPETG